MFSQDIILLAIFPMFVSFFITYILIKRWIPIAHKLGYVGKDMNKYDHPKVAEIGGLYAIIGTIFGLLIYVGVKSYILKTYDTLIYVFSIISLLSLVTILGLFDDILGWKKGLKTWQKLFLPLPLSLPLMVIPLDHTSINLLFIGTIDFGIFYSLLLIPLAILGTANAVNMLAGYNGLEAAMSLMLLGAVSIKSFLMGQYFITQISLIAISSIIAFLIFNWYPAKVFPGNAFTFGIGSLFGALVIFGNMEYFGLILFTLYFLELFLFLRGIFNGIYKENFGKPNEDGSLELPYNKIYSVTHLSIKLNKIIFGKATEKNVVLFILLMQVLITILAFLII